MNKYRKQAETTRAASAPKEFDTRAYREVAEDMVKQWGREMNQGGGAPNILAVFERLGDGDPYWHVSPGPIFSPKAERADIILRDMRIANRLKATALVAYALDIGQSAMARAFGLNRLQVRNDINGAFDAFIMGMYYRGRVLRQWTPTPRPRKMKGEDIGCW